MIYHILSQHYFSLGQDVFVLSQVIVRKET